MSQIGVLQRIRLRPFLLFVVFSLLALCGNYFSLSFSFGVDFLFGSIAVLVLLYFQGLWWGLGASALAAGYTLVLWQHPYAWIIFTLECLAVGLAIRRGYKALALVDVLYWLFIGIPLVWLFYSVFLEMDALSTSLIMLKQAVNGIFNAMAATLLIFHTPVGKLFYSHPKTPPLSLKWTINNMLVIAVVLPATLFMVAESQQSIRRSEALLAWKMADSAGMISEHIMEWVNLHAAAVDTLARISAPIMDGAVGDIQAFTDRFVGAFSDFHNMYVADQRAITIAFSPTVNKAGETTIGLDFSDRPYFKALRTTFEPVVSNVFMGRGGVFSPIVTLSSPMISSGEFAGYALGALDLSRVRQMLNRLGENNDFVFHLFDTHNNLIATSTEGLEEPHGVPVYTVLADFSRLRPPADNMTGSVYLRMPEDDRMPAMIRFKNAYYAQETIVSAKLPWKLIVEEPLAPHQMCFYAIYIRGFLIIIGLALGAGLISLFISRRIVRPIADLAKTTSLIRLDSAELSPMERQWPPSDNLEIKSLVDNFKAMMTQLAANFRNMENHRRQLTEVNQMLKDREHELHAILMNNPAGILLIDAQTRLINWANTNALNMLVAEIDQVVGRQCRQFVCSNLERCPVLDGNESPGTAERILLTVKGDEIPIIKSVTRVRFQGREHLLEAFFDISEKKRVEDERLLLARATEKASEGIIITDAAGSIRYVNPAFLALLGCVVEDLAAQPLKVIAQRGYPRDVVEKALKAALAGKSWTGRAEFKQGRAKRILKVTMAPVAEDADRPGHHILLQSDITQEMRLEERLFQAEKMKSIGTLAGGIAHDFNNILSAILGFTELALDSARSGTPLEENLQEIYAAGRRARDLVKQILAFARESSEQDKPLQVAVIAKETLKLLRSSIPESITIKSRLESDALVLADPTQIHQLFMNLCTNAVHAMGASGVLEVGMEIVSFSRRYLDLSPGSFIQITISDTGAGIAPEIIGSIFEPYFTTKTMGEGTGMGLSIVYSIVKKYGGEITVDSQPGKGSVFTVYLPVTQMKALPKHHYVKPLPIGNEHLLIVDDEAPIVKICAQILEGIGYTVTARTSSLEALALFRDKPDTFDLVITDLNMPNMNGMQLSAELRRIRSDIPIVLCSGYSETITEENAAAIGINAFANKPLVKKELAKTVRKVLDKAERANKRRDDR